MRRRDNRPAPPANSSANSGPVIPGLFSKNRITNSNIKGVNRRERDAHHRIKWGLNLRPVPILQYAIYTAGAHAEKPKDVVELLDEYNVQYLSLDVEMALTHNKEKRPLHLSLLGHVGKGLNIQPIFCC